VLIGALALAVVGCSSGDGSSRTASAAGEMRSSVAHQTVASGSTAERAVASAEQEFTFAMLRELVSSAHGANVAASPSSIATALSMLELGAAGTTASEIARALQTSHLSALDQAAGWNALIADLDQAGRNSKLDQSSANSVWLDNTFHLRPAFLDDLARNFGVGVRRTDFATQPDPSRLAINRWVAGQTHDRITDLFPQGSISEQTRLALVDAAYFKARWQAPFDPKATGPGPFHTAAGDRQVSSMRRTGSIAASRTADAEAVQLPYTDGRFAAVVVAPTSTDLTTYLARLDRAAFDRLLAGLTVQPVDLTLPKFEVRVPTTLNQHLEALGMVQAFSDSADLSPISTEPLTVSTVQHQAFVKVDEAGTEAAAGTGIGIDVTSAAANPLQITFDHPFLFLVRDTTTGTILFTTAIEDPSVGS
jgi:serpin B